MILGIITFEVKDLCVARNEDEKHCLNLVKTTRNAISGRAKKIRDIENKYGLILFRMSLTHLVDVGHRNLGDDEVEEGVRQIIAKGKEDEANGVMSVMTPEFQCEILRCSAELGKFSIVELFAYIKKYVHIGGV